MAMQPGWAYPVIISIGMGLGTVGLGQGVLEVILAAQARSTLFPSIRDTVMWQDHPQADAS